MFVSLGGPVSILQCHKAEDHECFWKEYVGLKSHKVARLQEAEWWSLLNLVEGVNEQDLGQQVQTFHIRWINAHLPAW